MSDEATRYRDDQRLRVVQELIAEYLPMIPLAKLRILDLASRTGHFSVALASRGSTVVGVEGRPENIAEMPSHSKTLKIVSDDVRNIKPSLGKFDVVLCLGILYHLNLADGMKVLRTMAEMGTGIIIVDTHISHGFEKQTFEGVEYVGHTYWDNIESVWGSIGNDDSWWPREEYLVQMLNNAGWRDVTLMKIQPYADQPLDRMWAVATK
jgi:hypothetical protein